MRERGIVILAGGHSVGKTTYAQMIATAIYNTCDGIVAVNHSEIKDQLREQLPKIYNESILTTFNATIQDHKGKSKYHK